ncbi:MAG: 1-acyl-sn-glycerol-3-phosphate acyltransferase [Lentisphaeraceae bacterium]|nr:1-acyl-sn-glycerol-3-phosphate acyltransferase [Lentisphaeraceae bacterium]
MTDLKLDYKTPDTKKRSFWDKLFRPFNAYFYSRSINTIVQCARKMDDNNYYDLFVKHCGMIIDGVEATGAKLEVYGLENVPKEPCVIIGNHMSTLETITLGHSLRERTKVAFVIKESLMKYPYFHIILEKLGCITVTRTNPIQDLKKILREGPALLEKGISIIVFPQHTRGEFDPGDFSSIGCKLAKRAKVPVVPLALDTRLWGKGKVISDLGPVNRDIPVRYAFGEPMTIEKNEKEVHAKCLDFIGHQLEKWDAYSPKP